MSKDGQPGLGEVAERMVLALKASNEGIWDWYSGEEGDLLLAADS
ncbi:MAG: hypothetical protein QM755_07700 [Luteolibacter sp.]